MTKAEIISQLQSLRDSTIDYAKGNNDPIFKKDVEALDSVVDFLNQVDHKASPNDALVPDCVPAIRCKDCKWYERDKQKGGFCRKSGAAMWSPGLPYDELKSDDYCSRAKRKEDEQ